MPRAALGAGCEAYLWPAMTDLAQGYEERVIALQRENERLSRRAALFEHAPDAALVTDAAGAILEANAAAGRLLGEAPNALRHRSLDIFIPLEQLRYFRERLQGAPVRELSRWPGTLRRLAGDVKVEFSVAALNHAQQLPLLVWTVRTTAS